jgi:hypothetical protein
MTRSVQHNESDHLKTGALRVARLHFVIVLLFAAQTIIYHASKLITPELLLKRWVAAALLLTATVLVWLLAKQRFAKANMYSAALWLIITADLAFAAFNIYTQRGYASKAVFLFVVPILVSALFARRSAIFATAFLAIATYTTTAISYFVLNFNEGYMAELYGEVIFYSALFLAIAALLWSTSHKQN